MLECRARTLLKKCNCIPYYYPRLDLLFAVKGESNNATRSNHPNTSICTWDGLQCLQNASGINSYLAKSYDHLLRVTVTLVAFQTCSTLCGARAWRMGLTAAVHQAAQGPHIQPLSHTRTCHPRDLRQKGTFFYLLNA